MDAKRLSVMTACAVILANAHCVLLSWDIDIEEFANYCESKNLRVNGGAMVWDDLGNYAGQYVYID